jgi:uncharacterized OsmC-like protein
VENRDQIQVRLEGGQACVSFAGGRFFVRQQNHHDASAGCPMQLMLGALGSCIILTLHAVAQHKGIVLRDTHLALEYHRNSNDGTRFEVTLNLDDHLTDRERKILYQSARICEVGKILKSDVQIDYHLLEPQSVRPCDPTAEDPGRPAAKNMLKR